MSDLMPKSVVYNEDCLAAMRKMRDNQFSLAIVDPPYGININHSIGRREGQRPSSHARVRWDSESPSAEYFHELFRVSENQIIWGANYFMSKIARDTPCWIFWDKKYSADVTFAQFEMAWTSFLSSSKKFEMVNNAPNKIHPTQKPAALYKFLLKNYAQIGDTILDTHGGSFSSRIACWDLGFDFEGYEIDKDYFDEAEERFQRHIAQGKLFEPMGRTPKQSELF